MNSENTKSSPKSSKQNVELFGSEIEISKTERSSAEKARLSLQGSLKPGQIVDLTIETLAFGGEGIAKIQVGDKFFTIFVEDVVPGDHIKAKIFKKKKNFAKAYLEEITKPSSLRIEPRCRHFGSYSNIREDQKRTQSMIAEEFGLSSACSIKTANQASRPFQESSRGCGGCTWQHLSYEQQLIYKERQVREALKHLGGIEESIVLPIIGMQDPWFYRNKMEFSFRTCSKSPFLMNFDGFFSLIRREKRGLAGLNKRRATQSGEKRRKIGENGDFEQVLSRTPEQKLTLGLHLKRRHYDVIELTECFLLAPYVGKLIHEARVFFQQLDQSQAIDLTLTLQSLTIRQGKNTGEIMIILSAENGEMPAFLSEFQQWLLTFFVTHQLPLTSLYFLHIHNQKGQPKSIQEHLLYGKSTIREELKLANGQKLLFEISPQAFFQPNTFQAQLLYQKALEAAGLTGREIVYDLFCGTGTIGIFCAQKARQVYGIELNASAIENAKANAKLNHLNNIEFLVGDVEKHLPKLAEKPDVIIVDPPRNGLTPKTIETILAFAPQKCVYVSCNPTTLARDAKLFMQGGYQLKSIQPVDMFPQTYHIENVALFEK